MRVVLVGLVLALACACQGEPAPVAVTETPAQITEAQVRSRCVSAIPDDAPVRGVTTLSDAADVTAATIMLPAVDIGPEATSSTAMVLLPQVNAGLCGWGRFASYAASQGFTSTLIDVCGYGDADCAEAGIDDIAGQVELAADHLRDQGARRVVVVGVSMGGSQAVRAAAGGAEVDGWADLSGPPTWDRVRLLDISGQIELPGFIGYARSDGARAYHDARRLARRTGAEFVDGGHGHGWELLLNLQGRPRPLASRLLAFVSHVR